MLSTEEVVAFDVSVSSRNGARGNPCDFDLLRAAEHNSVKMAAPRELRTSSFIATDVSFTTNDQLLKHLVIIYAVF